MKTFEQTFANVIVPFEDSASALYMLYMLRATLIGEKSIFIKTFAEDHAKGSVTQRCCKILKQLQTPYNLVIYCSD